MIENLESHVIYENPKPHVHSRHGFFPGLVELASGDLIAMFMIAEAFESPDGATFLSRSRDHGRSWELQGRLYDAPVSAFQTTDTLKPTLLRDGSLIAIGYRFHRVDPEQGIGIEATGGILPGDDIVSFSRDLGKTWTLPRIIDRTRPELLEISGPCIELDSGDLLAVAALFKMADGSNPSGQVGVLLRSNDGGLNWDDRSLFFRSDAGNMTPFESRICRMEDGRLVVLSWAYDQVSGLHFANQAVVSRDEGRTWSAPIDTGIPAQASGLLALTGNLLLTIHAHRDEKPGIVVRRIDFADDRWRVIEELTVWGKMATRQTRSGQSMPDMFTGLRFGQPSLIRLETGDFLATHWSIDEGQGRIRTHRLRVRI
jgi:sialidase-1